MPHFEFLQRSQKFGLVYKLLVDVVSYWKYSRLKTYNHYYAASVTERGHLVSWPWIVRVWPNQS